MVEGACNRVSIEKTGRSMNSFVITGILRSNHFSPTRGNGGIDGSYLPSLGPPGHCRGSKMKFIRSIYIPGHSIHMRREIQIADLASDRFIELINALLLENRVRS